MDRTPFVDLSDLSVIYIDVIHTHPCPGVKYYDKPEERDGVVVIDARNDVGGVNRQLLKGLDNVTVNFIRPDRYSGFVLVKIVGGWTKTGKKPQRRLRLIFKRRGAEAEIEPNAERDRWIADAVFSKKVYRKAKVTIWLNEDQVNGRGANIAVFPKDLLSQEELEAMRREHFEEQGMEYDARFDKKERKRADLDWSLIVDKYGKLWISSKRLEKKDAEGVRSAPAVPFEHCLGHQALADAFENSGATVEAIKATIGRELNDYIRQELLGLGNEYMRKVIEAARSDEKEPVPAEHVSVLTQIALYYAKICYEIAIEYGYLQGSEANAAVRAETMVELSYTPDSWPGRWGKIAIQLGRQLGLVQKKGDAPDGPFNPAMSGSAADDWQEERDPLPAAQEDWAQAEEDFDWAGAVNGRGK